MLNNNMSKKEQEFASITTEILAKGHQKIVKCYLEKQTEKKGCIVCRIKKNGRNLNGEEFAIEHYFTSPTYNTPIWKKVPPMFKTRIRENQDKIYVIFFGWDDLVSSFFLRDIAPGNSTQMNDKVEFNLNKKPKDFASLTEADKECFLIPFIKVAFDNLLDNLEGLTSDEIISLAITKTVEKINDRTLSSEMAHLMMIKYLYIILNKVTFEEKEKIYVIKDENMSRNFTEKEMEIFSYNLNILLIFMQKCTYHSNLSEQEDTDWDLDGMNFIEKFSSSQSLRFDNISPEEAFRNLYRQAA